MYSREEIDTSYINKDILADLKDHYVGNIYNDIKIININISNIVVHIKTFEGIPKFVLTRAIYSDVKQGVSMVRITIRPSKAYLLTTKDVKQVETFIDIENFYNDFIDFIISWVESYIKYAKMELNLIELNKYIEELTYETITGNTYKFTTGKLIESIDTNSITIGLKEDVVKNIIPILSNQDKGSIISLLNSCTNVYDIFMYRTDFTCSLGIYNSKSVVKILRSFVKKDISNVRTGLGYIDADDIFSIIERVASTDEEIITYENIKKVIIVEDNIRITKRELENNKTKIVSFYRVKPFKK